MVLVCDNLWSDVNLFVVKSTGESIKEIKKNVFQYRQLLYVYKGHGDANH